MTRTWKIKDIIDFQYFLGREKNGAGETDRQIYLEYTQNHAQLPDRRAVFRYWLKRRRQQAADESRPEALPGEIYTEAAAAARLILGALAFISGAVLAWSVLSYGGTTPVNVFTCLWILLAPQVILLIVLAASSFIYRFTGRTPAAKGLYALISVLILRISRRIINYAAAKAPQDKQNSLHSALGTAGRTGNLYGGLFFWPVFNIAQLTGVIFNIGILAALLLRITITDVAFGWQSTLYPDPQTVYRIVEVIALPWSWLADPPVSHPTADQIAGSRMVLKDGIYNLATGDLVSWWPFLCLSMAFYSLLPRVLLLITGLWRQSRHLAGLNFTHTACERLWLQMTAPQVTTANRAYQKPGRQTPAAAWHKNQAPDFSGDAGLMSALVAVPEEIEFDEQDLAQQLKTRLGIVPAAMVRVSADPEQDTKKLFSQQSTKSPGPGRLVFLQESWQPPIKENLAWIRHIKQAAGPDTPAVVCLIGRPGENEGFAGPVEKSEQIIWQQAVNSLADPYIRVETLGEQGSDE